MENEPEQSQPDPQQSTPPPLPGDVPPIPFARPLEYGRSDRRRGVPVPARWAIGCFGYILLSFAWFGGSAAIGSSWQGRGLPAWSGFAGWALMTLGLLGLTLWLRVRFGYKGYGYGILTALASAVLLVGGCVLLIIATCGHTKF